jgi:mannose-6-phosphate isomerase class I
MTENILNWRKTAQYLLPAEKPESLPGSYDVYPAHPVGEGKIFSGLATLATEMLRHSFVIIDGYQGVFFEEIRKGLEPYLVNAGKGVTWISMAEALKCPSTIDEMITPFLGGDDPLFGSRTTLTLADFFDAHKLASIVPGGTSGLTVVYGTGAALTRLKGLLIYIDLPKNELQFRARAGSITNIGAEAPAAVKPMYKRFYFVDWVVLNRHKQEIVSDIQIFADGQRPDNITWAHGDVIREALHHLSQNLFRVRPWFEPGTWGGDWCLQNIPGLNPDVPNYAWSFELIVPENGIVFESSGLLLELSFDTLMFAEAPNVLGEAYGRFGVEFPIRFDFLDTFSGGNLSVQCHPLPGYTKEHFNEDFTQEETYYILDARDNAVVYLGFEDNIDPAEFESVLTRSLEEGIEVDIEKYVRKLPSRKHDLFLIPPGTVHGSGIDNMVLEISSTPYIFTFKMYDWLRPDLDGKPRPLNIGRAMENLCFGRKGKYVEEKLISKPSLISEGEGWKIYHLPTHEKHLYDVHRICVEREAVIETNNKCHVLSLVEGRSVWVETANGFKSRFSYAETFVVPAAANSYRIINEGDSEVMLVKAFVK